MWASGLPPETHASAQLRTGRRFRERLRDRRNLLSNAIEFTPEGGEVRLAVRRNVGTITIAVKDTGIGIRIRSDFLPHIFEPFRQAESATRRVHGGLGLGLSIVRYLVELHGGRITAESAGEGQGTSFIVELPQLRARRRRGGGGGEGRIGKRARRCDDGGTS